MLILLYFTFGKIQARQPRGRVLKSGLRKSPSSAISFAEPPAVMNSRRQGAKAWVTNKKILSYDATNSFDEYPTHGVHGLYMIHRAIAEAGNPIVSVAYRSKNWHTPPGVMTFEHRDKNGSPFMGPLHQTAGAWGRGISTRRTNMAESSLIFRLGPDFRSIRLKPGRRRSGRTSGWRGTKRCHRRSIVCRTRHAPSWRVGDPFGRGQGGPLGRCARRVGGPGGLTRTSQRSNRGSV